MVREEDQVLLSSDTSWLARPEVASDPSGLTVTGETYQPLDPSGAGMESPAVGGVVSRWMVPLVETLLPATSKTVAVRSYVPSAPGVNVEPPPLMLAEATPELESDPETEAVTGETCHPFDPSGAGMESEI